MALSATDRVYSILRTLILIRTLILTGKELQEIGEMEFTTPIAHKDIAQFRCFDEDTGTITITVEN